MTGRDLVRFLRELLRQTEWQRHAVSRLPGGWRFQLSIANVATGELVELNTYQPFTVVLAFVQAERYGAANMHYHNNQQEGA